MEIMTAFPTGVAVVTTLDAEGRPSGLTSNAVTSVSADPPMLLVCVNKTSRTLPALRADGGFVVNFMGEGTDELCSRFASKQEADEKFAGVAWRPTPAGRPHLHADSVAYAECEIAHELEAGSHVVLLGRLVGGATTDAARAPIAYVRRTYRSWPGDAGAAVATR